MNTTLRTDALTATLRSDAPRALGRAVAGDEGGSGRARNAHQAAAGSAVRATPCSLAATRRAIHVKSQLIDEARPWSRRSPQALASWRLLTRRAHRHLRSRCARALRAFVDKTAWSYCGGRFHQP